MLPGVYITFDRVAGAVATDKPCRYRQVEWIPNGMAFGGGPPANRPPHCPPCSPARCASQLSFSIDRILAPDFGRTTAHKAAVQPSFVLRSPKRSENDDRNSEIPDDSDCSKSLFDDDTPGCISPSLFGTPSLNLEDPVFDTISVGVRNDIHNTSLTNCNIHDGTVSTNLISVMIPEENHKTHQLLSSWMSPNSASVISQSPVKELRHSSASDCSIPRENKNLHEQYRSRSAHEVFLHEISPLTNHVTPGSTPNVKNLMPNTLGDNCVLMASSDSEKAASCKSRNSRFPMISDSVKTQEHSELPPVLHTPSSKNAETRASDSASYAPAFSNSDPPQTSRCLPLKRKLLKPPAASDSNRLCRSLSPSTLRTTEVRLISEIPNDSKSVSNADSSQNSGSQKGSRQKEISTDSDKPVTWPAWVYCTRYSDRPSSGPRSRRKSRLSSQGDEKRSRTAFTGTQLSRLRQEFQENRYLTEQTRLRLAKELRLTESQVKIWFQNKRAKLKKSTGQKNPLALQLMAQGLYRHSVQHDSKEQ